jgi:hypothetical protein
MSEVEAAAPADEQAECRALMSARTVRERARGVLERCAAGELEHWRLQDEHLGDVAERVVRTIQRAYPDVRRIPYHSRWRHFAAGGKDRAAELEQRLQAAGAEERLCAAFELTITSVLLDAGAGTRWSFREPGGAVYTRSEGLAVASYELFMSGALSAVPGQLRVDASGLQRVDALSLARAFQVSPENPMVGLQGRAGLLRRLGEVVQASPRYFGPEQRLGKLASYLVQAAQGGRLQATTVLATVLDALGPIWPGREVCAGRNLGDTWRHSTLGLIPFHKLSQWLTYSLLEPLEAAGIPIDGVDELTGLAEYRNGGLFVDAGVVVPMDPEALLQPQDVGSDRVIEWRALTVALLDETAGRVRAMLQLGADELPLARVLEGGTWSAGRAIALEKRADGSPPLHVYSDGTVF